MSFEDRIWWARKTKQAIEAAIEDQRNNSDSIDALRDMRQFAAHLAACGSDDGDYISQEAYRISTTPPVYLHDLWDLWRTTRDHLDHLVDSTKAPP